VVRGERARTNSWGRPASATRAADLPQSRLRYIGIWTTTCHRGLEVFPPAGITGGGLAPVAEALAASAGAPVDQGALAACSQVGRVAVRRDDIDLGKLFLGHGRALLDKVSVGVHDHRVKSYQRIFSAFF